MAVTAETYTKSGAKSSVRAKLSPAVFDVNVNERLLRDAYVAYMANSRVNLAKTKTRGLVRGGGRKPWKQKGTGRARFGSIRVPIWRGGGITFGPTGEENYKKTLPRMIKRKAVQQALSLTAKEGRLKVIDSFETNGKVKPTVSLLEKLGAGKNVLIVVTLKNDLVERAVNNIPNVKAVSAVYLNVYDLLNADTVLVSSSAIEAIEGWLGKTNNAKTNSKKVSEK